MTFILFESPLFISHYCVVGDHRHVLRMNSFFLFHVVRMIAMWFYVPLLKIMGSSAFSRGDRFLNSVFKPFSNQSLHGRMPRMILVNQCFPAWHSP
jgi:hypothetical protein